ncbi:MAG TPA: hypothetical protein PKL99_08340, partial [Syntrophales bacterium]|nr:hypothetical protein [Syntrophales bacterium]
MGCKKETKTESSAKKSEVCKKGPVRRACKKDLTGCQKCGLLKHIFFRGRFVSVDNHRHCIGSWFYYFYRDRS